MSSSQEGISTPGPSAPRYRGFLGAAVYGVFIAVVVVVLGILAGAVLYVRGRPDTAVGLMARVSLLGVGLGLSACLSRWMCSTSSDRLFTLRFERGDTGGIGALAGLVLSGFLTDPQQPDHPRARSTPPENELLEIVGPTVDGGRFDLKEHRGKLVLIDFWATWCGPCLAELPNLRAVHERYHAKGFEVVGVSLDFERKQLDEYLRKNPIPWKHIYFDKPGSRGWENPLARRFGIDAIPHTILVGPDGRIIGRELRGNRIDPAVGRALGLTTLGDVLLEYGRELLVWTIRGIALARAWVLLSCVVSLGLAAAFLELLVRKMLVSSRLRSDPP